jgi:para-nitrobenzyl esterase
MSPKILAIGVLVVLMLVSVSGLLVPQVTEQRQSYFILPKDTDSEITTNLEPHYVALNKSVPARNQLFLFFPGTGGKPHMYQQIINTAADLGFHAIALNYPNDRAVNGPTLCGGTNTDLDCYAKVRLEIKDGTDRTPLVTITRANSIENRLIKLLLYLHARFPNDGWGQYLEDDLSIRWSSIVVSGHSQGGGHAGIIGRYHLVARVVMFAAMDYNARAGRPANWIALPSSTPNATPPERFYGFSHQRDQGVNFAILSTQIWPAYGMDAFGPVVNVDDTAPPYHNSHMLTSNLEAPTRNCHNCIVVDQYLTLLPDGTPVYKPVWEYLLWRADTPLVKQIWSGSQLCPADENVVATEKGCVRGESLGAVKIFRGIPYAAPPVGNLRWKAPQEHPSWDGVRDATQFGKSCPQLPGTIFRYQLETDEDCLSLNIWTPKIDPNAKLPVMVWIHGGGLVQGSSSQKVNDRVTYDGRVFAERFGVVVVTINYRLAQLGFLAHPALSAEDIEHNVSGNYGLLDQIFALRWVQKNIQNFGGDPQNVTIFGESGGGKSVCALLASTLAAGLFQRAIIQSGGCPSNLRKLRGSSGRESAEAQGERFARAIGCADAPDVLACLRSKSVQEILQTLPGEASILSTAEKWDFTVDGYALLQSPGRALEAGNFNVVPVIAGTTGNEASIFTVSLGIQTVEQYEAYVRSIFRGLADQVLALYPASAYPSPKAALDALISDVSFVCPTRRFVRDISKSQQKTFLYHFTYVTRAGAQLGLGAFHGSEIPFVFGNLTNPTLQERALSDAMMRYWVNFAKTGDPNDWALPAWPAYTLAGDPHLQLDVPIKADRELRKRYCDFFDQLQPRKSWAQ